MLCILKQTYVHMTRHVDPYIIDKSQFEKLTLNRLESLATIKLIACLALVVGNQLRLAFMLNWNDQSIKAAEKN